MSEEPRLRYQGRVILDEYPRTVGIQTFVHIVCDDGTEYDLSEAQRRTEVYVTYPPTN